MVDTGALRVAAVVAMNTSSVKLPEVVSFMVALGALFAAAADVAIDTSVVNVPVGDATINGWEFFFKLSA